MGIKLQRHTYRLGASRVVTLPLAWCNFYGDKVRKVTILGNSVLLIAPEGLEAEAERLMKEVENMK